MIHAHLLARRLKSSLRHAHQVQIGLVETRDHHRRGREVCFGRHEKYMGRDGLFRVYDITLLHDKICSRRIIPRSDLERRGDFFFFLPFGALA